MSLNFVSLRAYGMLVLFSCTGNSPQFHGVDSKQDELRPTDTNSNLMWRFQSTDIVESFSIPDSGFKLHFTKNGINKVPAPDIDDSGIPDFIERSASTYVSVGSKYESMGFRRPLSDEAISANGGDDKFDVYFVDFNRAADGAFRVDTCPAGGVDACIGYVVQENDFVGYAYPNANEATKILASHEYFHAVQAAYDNGQDVVISEGSAVWASEQFDSSTQDLENFVHGYLDTPDRSLDSPPPGPVPTFAYGSAIFFQFLSEKYGASIVKKLWEHLENSKGDVGEPLNQSNPTWLIQLDALLKREYQSSFGLAFSEFAKWNLYTQSFADPTVSYANGAQYPLVANTTITLPLVVEDLRVYYASTQYFRAFPFGRTGLTALILDNPMTPIDDTVGMQLVLMSRTDTRNLNVKTLNNTGLDESTGGNQYVLALVNTARGPNGVSLSQRPLLCMGSKTEVAQCRDSFLSNRDAGTQIDGGMAVDSGVVDSGIVAAPDASIGDAGFKQIPRAPNENPVSQGGCHINNELSFCALLVLLFSMKRTRFPEMRKEI
jgi:hypothetical protein